MTDPVGIKRKLSLLQAVLDGTADGILVVDLEGRVASFNRRFAELWKMPEELAATWDDNQALAFVLDQLKDPGTFVAKVMQVYAHPESESHDAIEFKDGRVLERTSSPQRVGSEVVGRVWTFRDITDRVRVEAELDRALEFVLDQLKDPERFLKKVRELYDHPDAQSYDWLEFKDGRVFERYSGPQRVSGRIVGRVWSFRDVSDRRRMEEMLRRQARTFEHIFDAVIVMDLDARVLEWNPGAERVFGWTKEEMLGKSPAALYASAKADLPAEMLKEMRGRGRFRGEVAFRRKDGAAGFCETIVVPHTDEWGRIVAAIQVNRDITELKRLREGVAPVPRT